MKIGAFYENIATGCAASGVSLKSALKRLKKYELELIYINYQVFTEQKDTLLPVLEELDLQIEGFYHFYDLGRNPEDTSWQEMLDDAAKYHVSSALIIPGMIPDKELEGEYVTNMLSSVRRAAIYGKMKNVKVCMEPFDSLDAPNNSIVGLRDFIYGIPQLYCAFDTGNFALVGDDELKAFETFRYNVCVVHLKDRSREKLNPGDVGKPCKDGSVVYPAPLGSGYIRIKEILDQLKEQNYEGNVIIELYDYQADKMLDGIEQSMKWILNDYVKDMNGGFIDRLWKRMSEAMK